MWWTTTVCCHVNHKNFTSDQNHDPPSDDSQCTSCFGNLIFRHTNFCRTTTIVCRMDRLRIHIRGHDSCTAVKERHPIEVRGVDKRQKPAPVNTLENKKIFVSTQILTHWRLPQCEKKKIVAGYYQIKYNINKCLQLNVETK